MCVGWNELDIKLTSFIKLHLYSEVTTQPGVESPISSTESYADWGRQLYYSVAT